MKISILFFTLLFTTALLSQPIDYARLSQDILYAAKSNTPANDLLKQLKEADQKSLSRFLNQDDVRKAFWLNIYNAYIQIYLHKDAVQYQYKNKFFRKKSIEVAGHSISLDLIEHGILRHSKVKWGLGYIGKLFPKKFETHYRIDTVDYRIHFALNCGAKSCPPILFYKPERINQQLNMVTKNYLSKEVKFAKDSGIVYLPRIMNWFRGDFGGKSGMVTILQNHQLIPFGLIPSISFKEYNWQLSLNNYWEE
jgi:hypothetical protein